MRKCADPSEVATIIAEDNTVTKKTVKLMHDAFRGIHPEATEFVKRRAEHLRLAPDFFPLRKLKDTVHFAEKRGAILLQVADACAWMIRSYLEGKPSADEFYSALVPSGPQRIKEARGHYGGANELKCWD